MHYLNLSTEIETLLNVSHTKNENKKMLTGKAAQTTVSQTSVFLHVLQFLHVQTQLQRTAHRGVIKQPIFRSCLFYSDKTKLRVSLF